MRKITSFVTMCLLLMVSMATKAQSVADYGEALITDASQFYDNEYGDASEGTDQTLLLDMNNGTFWHTDWHNASHPDGDHHWLFVKFDEPVTGNVSIWMNRRSTANDHPTKMLVEGSNDAPGENVDGKGAGASQKWTSITEVSFPYEGSGSQTECIAFNIADPGYKYLRFAASDCTGDSYSFRKFWHVAEFQLYVINDDTARLIAALNSILNKYDAYCRASQGDYAQRLNMGTEFGQYTDTDAEAVFLEGLDEVYAILDGTVELPDEATIDALVNKVEDAYAKVLASEVLYTLRKDGYYRILGTMQYYQNVETGETDEEGNTTTKRDNYHDIAMYGMLEGYAAWGAKDATDCRQIWKLEQKEGGIKMVNAATDMQISEFSAPVKMSLDADTLMGFDFVGIENDREVLIIRMAGTARYSGNYYLHQWGHSRGAGEGYYLCQWANTYSMGDPYDSDKGTSEWYLEEVSTEEAEALIKAYEPVKNHDVLVLNYEDLLSKAKEAVALSKEAAATAMVTENSQFQSWCTEPNEGSINNLLDGDPATFWHSAWSSGSVDNHTHGFDVMFNEPISGTYKVWVQRRGTNANDDNVVKFSVYGSNDEGDVDASAETYGSDANWTKIADLTLPWSSSVAEQYADEDLVIAEPYKYIRFYNDETNGPNSGNKDRGYFHMGGFNIYQITGVPQFDSMGKVAEDMVAAIAVADALDRDGMVYSDFTALQAAYDAFQAALVNPEELRTAISTYANTCKDFIEGADPGRYPNADIKNEIEATVEAARAYDNKGKYTQAESAAFIEKLQTLAAAYAASRNTISTGKWYKFRHMNDEEGEMFPGIKGAGAAAVFGKYIGVGFQAETNNAETNELLATDDMHIGDKLYFFDAETAAENEDAVKFRFVQVTDSTYAIQNKATGLYISRSAENSYITMQPTPAPTMVKSVGYGQNLLITHTTDGVKYDKPNINCWAGNGLLVCWWSDTNPGCNSTYMIETCEDAEDFTPEYSAEIELGRYNALCYSVSLKDVEGEGEMYSVLGTYTEGDKNYVGLKKIEKSEPGVPFVYIVGEPSDYKETDGETVSVKFEAGSEIVLNPSTDGPFVGTNVYQWVDPGYVAFYGNKAVFTEGEDGTDCSRDIYAHSGYVVWNHTTVAAGDCDLALEISGTTEEGIQAAIANVSKNGNVYNMAGQLVRSNANLNTLKGLNKGIYMLNGTKVLVK